MNCSNDDRRDPVFKHVNDANHNSIVCFLMSTFNPDENILDSIRLIYISMCVFNQLSFHYSLKCKSDGVKDILGYDGLVSLVSFMSAFIAANSPVKIQLDFVTGKNRRLIYQCWRKTGLLFFMREATPLHISSTNQKVYG